MLPRLSRRFSAQRGKYVIINSNKKTDFSQTDDCYLFIFLCGYYILFCSDPRLPLDNFLRSGQIVSSGSSKTLANVSYTLYSLVVSDIFRSNNGFFSNKNQIR